MAAASQVSGPLLHHHQGRDRKHQLRRRMICRFRTCPDNLIDPTAAAKRLHRNDRGASLIARV